MALKRATYTSPAFRTVKCRVGRRGGGDEALAVKLGRTASSADLGGSSKYSSESLED